MSRPTKSTALHFFLLLSFCVSISAAEWSKETVYEGAARPSLALGSEDQPCIAFMREIPNGFIRFAEMRYGQWRAQQVASGFFYGPLDIIVSGSRVIINYHDENAQDQMIASGEWGAWAIEGINHPGNDGWDNVLGIDNIGDLHTLTTDPVDFGGAGLEYTSLVDGDWEVEQVGSGPLTYGEGLSLAYDETDRPHISFHNTFERSLYHGVRESSGWRLTRVDSGPEAGMFSSIAIRDGNPIISYVAFSEMGPTEVRLAAFADDRWSVESIDVIEDLTTGLEFARNATCLRLDGDGNPHVAYSGESAIKFAAKVGDTWQIEVVDTIEDNVGSRFGQQVDLERDGTGNWHLVSFDVIDSYPLNGNILYYRTHQ
jgi:hypothetical protein